MSDCADHKPLCDFCDSEPSVVEADGVSVTPARRTRHVVYLGNRCIKALAERAGLTVTDECDRLRERYDETRRLAAALLKAINDDERNGINNATLKALVALRLNLSPDGAVNHLVTTNEAEASGT